MTNSNVYTTNNPAQSICPSGEQEFGDIARSVGKDKQISRLEADAAVACDYGHHFPRRSSSEVQEEALRQNGEIGAVSAYFRNKWEADIKAAGIDINDPNIWQDLQNFEQSGTASEAARIKLKNNRELVRSAMFFNDGNMSEASYASATQRPDVEVLSETLQENPRYNGGTHAVSGVSLVDTSEGHTANGHTVIHEAVHQYSHPNVEFLPSYTREGMTEFFTVRTLQRSGASLSGLHKGYNFETQSAFQLSRIVGENVMEQAYFAGDMAVLETAFDAKAGQGAWKQYIEIIEHGKGLRDAGQSSEVVSTYLDQFYDDKPGIKDAVQSGTDGYEQVYGESVATEPAGIDHSG